MLQSLRAKMGLVSDNSTADKLAEITIKLLENHPTKWKFSGTRAEFEEYFCKVDFSSLESLEISMRSQDHQAIQNSIRPSLFMRKKLIKTVVEARDTKIMEIISTDLYNNQTLLLEKAP